MFDWLLHQDAALLCLFAGLVAGAAVGFALGHGRGRLGAIDAMRRWADANEVADPHEAIAARMRELDGMMGTQG